MTKKTEPAIEVKHITKKFVLPKYQNNSLKQLIVHGFKRNEKINRTVLNNVSFTINKGDFFGIVGRNGSGKSTLLKLICGIYTPTSGEIVAHGKITPFIELGVGFNPELSGRDNVYLNGALLGFTRKQMRAMYDEIVEFAELEEFMDLKLKNYSSGMQVRLAFSIAIKAKNDILIFDEVLAVGDEAFQRKCIKIFEDYRRNKQTVVLVTHSMETVRSLCTKALMVENGKIKVEGSVKTVANAYQRANALKSAAEKQKIYKKLSSSKLSVSGCISRYYRGDVMKLKIRWPKKYVVEKVGVAIIGEHGENVFSTNTGNAAIETYGMDYSVDLNIGPGQYHLMLAIYSTDNQPIEVLDKAAFFSIYDDFDTEVGGIARLSFNYSKPNDLEK